MFPIKKISAQITAYQDLSKTAREITITTSEPFNFIAGSFVNIFINHEGVVHRRAFSISSSDLKNDSFNIAIRLNPQGTVTPLFWKTDIVGTKVEVMGPLGINTADKMLSSRIFLFGYGIGAGVVKSLAEHFVTDEKITEITIMTGNRSETEIIHKDFFDQLKTNHLPVEVEYIVSDLNEVSPFPKGYIQNHLSSLNFDNSDVYVCGQEVACNALVETVKKSQPINCHFFIEGFH